MNRPMRVYLLILILRKLWKSWSCRWQLMVLEIQMVGIVNVACLGLSLLVITISPVPSKWWRRVSRYVIRLRHYNVGWIGIWLTWVIIFKDTVWRPILQLTLLNNLCLRHQLELLLHLLLSLLYLLDVNELCFLKILILPNTLLFLCSLECVGWLLEPSVNVIGRVSYAFNRIDYLVCGVSVRPNDRLVIFGDQSLAVLLWLNPKLTTLCHYSTSLWYLLTMT